MTTTTPAPHPPTSAIDELTARIAELERTQQAEDVEGFCALFDGDAVWVTGGGVRLVGRDAIVAFTREVLPGAFATGTVRYEIEHIRLITDDVALTSVNQEYLDGDGRSLTPPRAGRPTYVWHRRDGRWLIASGQNTSVPHEPGDARLADEPAGYWTGAAHEAIIGYIGIEDGKLGVTQRHWMTFNALASSEEGMTRAEITERLGQYMTPQIGGVDTFPAVLDDVVHRGFAEMDAAGRLRLTDAGTAKRAEIAVVADGIRAHLHTGIADEDYVTTVIVLRRMIENAHASDQPSASSGL